MRRSRRTRSASSSPNRLDGGVERGWPAPAYTLEIDSPAAVRAANELIRGGVETWVATEPFSAGPAGTLLFSGGHGVERRLDDVGRARGLEFGRLRGAPPARERVERVPRFRVLYNPGNFAGLTDFWPLEQLGFEADPVTVGELDTAAADPLAGYDVLFNSAVAYPPVTNAVARNRVSAFFAAGGGYIGGQATGANFLTAGAQVTGLSAVSESGDGSGYSGIVLWDNLGGPGSVVTGAYPGQDTMIVDPPTWLTSLAPTMTADGRFATTNFFLSGLFPPDVRGDAAGAAVIAHGTNAAGSARLAVFANNPLYRADPEREWPMLASAAYWADGQ